MTDLTYTPLAAALESAGFFTTLMPLPDTGHRLVCASKKSLRGLHGNSFWIAERHGQWFLGTWGPYLYHIPDPSRVADLCLTLLRRHPDHTLADIAPDLQSQFHLTEIPDLPA